MAVWGLVQDIGKRGTRTEPWVPIDNADKGLCSVEASVALIVVPVL